MTLKRYAATWWAAQKGRAARTEAKQERIERYAELLRGGYTPVQACWEMHITRRTGHRYEDALKEMGR